MGICKVAMIGIGGFGKNHTQVISDLSREGHLECVAFAEPDVSKSREQYDTLTGLGARHFTDYKEMLEACPEVDFVVLSTPIALHKPMSVYALDHGFHVLTEKPPAVTVQDVREMMEAQERSGKRLAVQFQNTSGDAFRKAIDELKAGTIGELQKVTGVGMWKRTDEYYERTPWAGKIMHRGEYVLDGTMHNPFAHLLFNCLIAAGSGDARRAEPESVQAELYSGHRIESEDTVCLRAKMKNGVELMHFTTLCHHENAMPHIEMQGTRGTIVWHYDDWYEVKTDDGEERKDVYGTYDSHRLMKRMYHNMMEAIRNPEAALNAPIDAALNYVLLTNAAFLSAGHIQSIPDEDIERVKEGDTVATYIRNVREIFQTCAEKGELFSESGISWAVKTEPFPTEGFEHFEWKS